MRHYPHGLAQRVGQVLGAGCVRDRNGDRVSFDLGRPACHVPEEIHGQRYISHPRNDDGLPVVERLKLGELLKVCFDQVGQLPNEPSALRSGHPPPGPALESVARGFHRSVNVFLLAFSHLRQDFPAGWVKGGEGLSRGGLDPFATDQHLAGLCDKTLHPLINLNSRCNTHGSSSSSEGFQSSQTISLRSLHRT